MQERDVGTRSGWAFLPLAILAWVLVPGLVVWAIWSIARDSVGFGVFLLAIEPLVITSAVLLSKGLFVLQPNEARVLVLFGRYAGTVRRDGFHWANPFSVHRSSWQTVRQDGGVSAVQRTPSRYVVSLRARNFETDKLKVNDQRGNPIEIRAVVVWRVADTSRALFEVDEYEHYVTVQSETAVRHLASLYPYDHSDDAPGAEITLRGNTEEVGSALLAELAARLEKAGVAVEEARLTHLAYAPEIAGVMLRRQQAEALIAARQKIVRGAVSMVQMALAELAEQKIVDLDPERKAAMVGNLLVVLCGESEAQPVINTGAATQ